MQFKDRKEFEERLSKCIEDMNEILEDLRKNDDEKTVPPDPAKLAEAKRIQDADKAERGGTKPNNKSSSDGTRMKNKPRPKKQFPEDRRNKDNKLLIAEPNKREMEAEANKLRAALKRHKERQDRKGRRLSHEAQKKSWEAGKPWKND